MKRRQTPIAEQNARRAQLDHIRQHRSLTPCEEQERERLDNAFYMRTWRKQQREHFGKAINVLPLRELRGQAS